MRGTARVLWTLVWLFIPLSLFSILVLGTMVSGTLPLPSPSPSTTLAFRLTLLGTQRLLDIILSYSFTSHSLPWHWYVYLYFTSSIFWLILTINIQAAHKLWSPKRGVIWPFVTFIILLLLLVVGFSVLLSAVRGSQNSATTSPTLPLPRNLGKGAMANPSFYLGVDQDDHNRVSFASNSTSHNTSYHRDYMGYQICYSDWKGVASSPPPSSPLENQLIAILFSKIGLDAIDFGLFSYLAYYDYGTSDFDTLFNRWYVL